MREFKTNELPQITRENTFEHPLYSDTKTLPIFDEFRKPQYQYLLLKWMGWFKKKIRFHLIISKIPFECSTHCLKRANIGGNLTATYLKNSSLYITTKQKIDECAASLKPLQEEIYNVLINKEANSGDIFLFENPCYFEAQDSSYRSGFGLPKGATSFYDDNNFYGDCRKYAIIGVKIA